MDILDIFWTFYLNHLSPLQGHFCLSMESIRLDGPAHGIVTKTVHKTLPGGGWVGGAPGGGGVQGWVGVVQE